MCKLVSTYHKDISCQLQLQEEFEDTKEQIGGQTTQRPNKNRQQDTTIYKTIDKTKDRVTERHLKPGVNSDAPEG